MISFAQTLDNELKQVAQNNNLVGMSVVTTCNGQVSNVFHYGLSDIDRDISVSDNTHYRIASISKTVTATALMILFQEDLFELDDDISDYLGYEIRNPNYSEIPITFRMLLSHTSSLQDGSGYSDFLSDTYSQTPPPNINEVLLTDGNYYTSNMWRTEEPGTYFAYSNMNYCLIGTLIEKISGKRFDNYVRENLFIPLEIRGSFNVSHLENIDDLAVLYRNSIPQADNYQGISPTPFDSTGYDIGTNGAVFAPQGGLRISALDLSKFMLFHSNYGKYNNVQIMDSSVIALMHTPEWTYNGSNGDNYYNLFNQWGLGLHITTNTANGDIVIDDEKFYGHPGEAYGLISDMYFSKGKNFGVIFMTNGYYGSAGYQWGNYSAFYVPEEEVFSVSETYAYDNCFEPTFISDISQVNDLSFYYNSDLNKIILDKTFEGNLNVYDITGKLQLSKHISEKDIGVAELKNGLYIFILSNNDTFFSKKVYVE